MEWSRAKANRVLPRECTGHSKHPLPTTQEKTLHMDITRWSTPKSDWLCSLQPEMEKLYTVTKTRQGADCSSDHKLLIAKCRLKLKKVGKTTRPFRYDLNQILYNYTVEVRNRFKGLDLIDRVLDWTMNKSLWHCTEDRYQDHPQEKEIQERKMAVWGGLTNICEKKGSKNKRRKRKIYPLEGRVPKNSKKRWESLPQWSVQRNRGKQYNGKD